MDEEDLSGLSINKHNMHIRTPSRYYKSVERHFNHLVTCDRSDYV